MVWIYGGGFTEGSKTLSGNPAGLIARSQVNGQEGVIFVAMNYRLGLFVSTSLRKYDTADLFRVGCLDQLSKRLAPQILACSISVLLLTGFKNIFISSVEIQTE